MSVTIRGFHPIKHSHSLGVLTLLILAAFLTVITLQQKQLLSSHAAGTNLAITVFLHGIGNGGDSANPNSGGNTNPFYKQRTLSVTVSNSQNVVSATKDIIATYNANTGNFLGNADFGTLPSGEYTISIKADRYLRSSVPGIQTITAGQTNQITPVYLIAGDSNGDNRINIIDFNSLMGCYSDLTASKSCTSQQKIMTDLTDDGNVDQLDYNLFIREISNRSGSSTPPVITTTPSPTRVPTATPGQPSDTITSLPPQPAAIMYGDPTAADLENAKAYKHPGALVSPGRVTYNQQVFKDISSSGGTVLIYLDVMIDASYGRYHTILMKSSECGAAVPLWPGNPKANQWGNLNDFRVGGILQSKLECVLEKMVAENPHMGGWFADDVGSRSYYPDINWDVWSVVDKQSYRDGAIAITKIFRKVADKHGLVFLVNGTWGAGSLASAGGGYPDMNQSGNALADGGVVEHHTQSELPYFKSYACSSQWASQSLITKGHAIMFSINNNASDRAAYAATNCFAYVTAQTEDAYGTAPTPWTTFHITGLPSKVK